MPLQTYLICHLMEGGTWSTEMPLPEAIDSQKRIALLYVPFIDYECMGPLLVA